MNYLLCKKIPKELEEKSILKEEIGELYYFINPFYIAYLESKIDLQEKIENNKNIDLDKIENFIRKELKLEEFNKSKKYNKLIQWISRYSIGCFDEQAIRENMDIFMDETVKLVSELIREELESSDLDKDDEHV